jgi:hypothetical protein
MLLIRLSGFQGRLMRCRRWHLSVCIDDTNKEKRGAIISVREFQITYGTQERAPLVFEDWHFGEAAL